MLIYQYIGVLIGIIIVLFALLRLKNGKMATGMAFLWIIICAFIIWFSIFPQSTNAFASILGIGRGLDVILVLGLLLGYYLIFKMYSMIEKMDREITLLVREIALQRTDLKEKAEHKHSKIDLNHQEKDEIKSK